MRNYLMLVAVGLAVASCVRPSSPPAEATAARPTLVVDFAHSLIGQPEGQEGIIYKLPPFQQLSVDARSFDFSASPFPDVRPNAIQLIIDEERQYSADWHSSGLSELSAATLTPLKSSSGFAGLRSGDRAMIAIGKQQSDAEKKEIKLKVLWAGAIEVQ